MLGVDRNNRSPKLLTSSASKSITLEEPSEIEPAVPRPTEPTPNLCIAHQTPPTPGPSTSRDQAHSNGIAARFFPDSLSNRALNIADPPFTSARSQPNSSEKKSAYVETPDLAVEASLLDVSNNRNLKSLAFSGAKSILRGVRESADVFGPLKSVAGGLCFILENYEVQSSPLHPILATLTGLSANEGEQTINRIIDTSDPCNFRVALRVHSKRRCQRGIQERSSGTVSPHPPILGADSDIQIARKLQGVHQDLNLLAEQGKVEGFFNNLENADKLSGLVEDTRDAMMEYQVCIGATRISRHP